MRYRDVYYTFVLWKCDWKVKYKQMNNGFYNTKEMCFGIPRILILMDQL